MEFAYWCGLHNRQLAHQPQPRPCERTLSPQFPCISEKLRTAKAQAPGGLQAWIPGIARLHGAAREQPALMRSTKSGSCGKVALGTSGHQGISFQFFFQGHLLESFPREAVEKA